MASRGYLVLEDTISKDPQYFEGEFFGYPLPEKQNFRLLDKGYGEVVFNTSMTGYQEILTDPSYYGQIITFTHPHIGNTGINHDDNESLKIWAAGIVVHDYNDVPSNWRSHQSLATYLQEMCTPGLTGVDTRALTRYLRTAGVVRGFFIHEADKDKVAGLFKNLPTFEGRDLIKEVSTQKMYYYNAPEDTKFKVVAVDFGVKKNLLECLRKLGCAIQVVPASTAYQDILNQHPDGVFLSNGPGDPKAAPYAREMVKNLVGKIPIFGVCMGHQILALSMGAETYKLKFGHRGANQPVIGSMSQKVEISSHNHGYSVSMLNLPAAIEITHLNLNDKTVEGLEVKNMQAFSVQYHPEACPGPHDSFSLFERFTDMMERQCIKST